MITIISIGFLVLVALFTLLASAFWTAERFGLCALFVVLIVVATICFCVYCKVDENNTIKYYNISVDGIDYVCDDYDVTDTTIKLYIDENTTIVLMLHYDTEIIIKKEIIKR